MRPFAWSVLLTLAAALAGCGHGAPSSGGLSFPSTPLLTVTSQSGALTVAVRTSPQPPTRGVLGVQYTITGAHGAPQDGLTLTVTPWMTAMGHGTSVTPSVSAQGHGVYTATNVYAPMPGQWELRTQISGGVHDSATPTFEVQ